ncbi:CTP synthase [hydrothermal vent metagenome]|uniref:CTP synthase n=1 Tax=hydrothermal vent metagenome TaxID=652676 RepID=A0A3B0QRL4_9ZZZZ
MADTSVHAKTKFIFVTGGVVSSLGKGIASASIGALLEARGLKITLQKLDPYINVDPGTMSPFQHGEVFVTDDGSETDLDLGHYERFTTATLTKVNNFTTGQVYDTIIKKERRGDYLGGTVQVVPHVTDEIKKRVLALSNDVDVALIEIGGTVGDIESLPFLEAIRQLRYDLGKENVLYLHLTLVPYIATAKELKTKPTQHSVNKLREIGIQPDILLCRTDRELEPDLKRKIALFCNVDLDAVVAARDVESVYEVPLALRNEGIDDKIVKMLNIWTGAPKLDQWEKIVKKLRKPRHEVTIGIVGKYVDLQDSYKSMHEALIHGGLANNARVNFKYIDSEDIEKKGAEAFLGDVDGVLVPGGFGSRGIEGKVSAIKYLRENKKPFFGICLGMQMAVMEVARNIAGLAGANSVEFDPDTKYPVVDLMEGQRGIEAKGGTMRLGAYPCTVKKGTHAYKAYASTEVSERHRHRFEVNNEFRSELEKAGLEFSGVSPDGTLVEIAEFRDHPWFLGCQFHPEFKSSPASPHPLFKDFVKAVLKYKQSCAGGLAGGAKKCAQKKTLKKKTAKKKTVKKARKPSGAGKR